MMRGTEESLRFGDVVGIRGFERRPGHGRGVAADVHQWIRGAFVGGGDDDRFVTADHERPCVHRVGHPGQRFPVGGWRHVRVPQPRGASLIRWWFGGSSSLASLLR